LPMDGAESAAVKIERSSPGTPPVEQEAYFQGVSEACLAALRHRCAADPAIQDGWQSGNGSQFLGKFRIARSPKF
jgi:hypothetical protein